MDRAHRTYLLAFAAILGFELAYFLTALNPVVLPWYYPLEHRWAWELRPQGLAMDWYGRLAWGAVGSLVVGAAGAVALRVWAAAEASRLVRALAIWTVTLFVFSAALFIYQLAPRHPFPAALPPGYQAR